MSDELVERAREMQEFLADQAAEAEELGKLPDETAKRLKSSGVLRMLQPREWGGYESDPDSFLEAVMALGPCGATAWVAGVVGVHPWELALLDPKAQEEVWGEDPDTLIASPYTPTGRARPSDDGYVFSGKWSFSSGTDHCDWIFLGGLVVGDDGEPLDPPASLHFLLPRSDYEIVEDSWNVVGLRGTGSKDIVVRDAYVPAYRTIDASKVLNGQASKESGREAPLYCTPWSAVFPAAITAAVIGIAEAALDAVFAYQSTRTNAFGTKATGDPHVLRALGEASSEIHASRVQHLSNVRAMFDLVVAGKDVPLELRAQGRRDQVRASWRSVEAIDDLFGLSGGSALRNSLPLQRLWRDAHAGLNHAINLPGPAYTNHALGAMGQMPADAFI